MIKFCQNPNENLDTKSDQSPTKKDPAPLTFKPKIRKVFKDEIGVTKFKKNSGMEQEAFRPPKRQFKEDL